jgi:G protein beta subunit-like protein
MPGTVILATASYDHTIRFWEAHTGKCKAIVQHPESQVNKMEITPDRQFLAAAGNPNIRFFEIESRHSNAVVNFSGHTNNVTAVGFQKEGKWMYTGSEDGTVKIWDINAPGCQREIKDKVAVNAVVLHPNQVELFVGYQDGTVKVFDLSASSKPIKEAIPEDDTAIRSLSVSPDGSLLCAVNNSGNCFIWNLYSSPLTKSTTNNADASNSNQTATSNFDYMTQFQAHKTYVLKCLFSPNGKYENAERCISHPSNGTADSKFYQLLLWFSVRLLATAAADNVAKIWQYNNSKNKWEEDKTLIGHTQWVWDCWFSADSAYLLTGTIDSQYLAAVFLS